jgi:hypothetical protein
MEKERAAEKAAQEAREAARKKEKAEIDEANKQTSNT